MSHLTHGDADLHFADGSHRSTAPSAVPGSGLERYERRIRAHLEAHQRQQEAWNRLLEQSGCDCIAQKFDHPMPHVPGCPALEQP